MIKRYLITLIVILTLLFCSYEIYAHDTEYDVFYVDSRNKSFQDGSIESPYSTINQALNYIKDNMVILVAGGIYNENLILPENNSVRIVGGFQDIGFSISEKDYFPTIIRGNKDKAVIHIEYTGGQGNHENYEIENITLENGQRGIYAINMGNGGIASLRVSNCIIRDNSGLTDYTDYGGGIYSNGFRALINLNLIQNNSCGKAGGIFVRNHDIGDDILLIEGNTIENNSVFADHGAGAYIQVYTGIIRQNTFRFNHILESYGWGGGLVIDGNTYTGFNDDVFMALYNNIYHDNEAPSGGSGIFIDEGANIRMKNELIHSNTVIGSYLNAPVYIDGPRGTVHAKTIMTNCTITKNTGGQYSYGHAIGSTGGSEVYAKNSIFWSNNSSNNNGGDFFIDNDSSLIIQYCIYDSENTGNGLFIMENSFSADPLFGEFQNNNFYLKSREGRWDSSQGIWMADTDHSPAIDAGDPQSSYIFEPAPNGNRVNMGVYGNTIYASKSEMNDQEPTYQIGPDRIYKTLQEITGLLNPGDIVEVDGDHIYPGEIIFNRPGTSLEKIHIKGIRINGNRPIISGGVNAIAFTTPYPYNTYEGGHHYILEGFEISGASNRGIFHQARDLIIRDCLVRDCANGILGADQGSGSLLLEYTEITRCGEGGSRHQIYMATDQINNPGSIFRMQHCFIHEGLGGNNVKSRAERNEIYYNWIEGAYYHELELIGADWNADGGNPHLAREDSDVVGNVLIKKQTIAGNNPNFYTIRIGGDGTGESHGRYRFLNNTIICGTSAVFRIFDSLDSLEVQNNVLFNPSGNVLFKRTVEAEWVTGSEIISGKNNWVKTGTQQIPEGLSGTIFGLDPGFQDISSNNLFPLPDSALRNAGTLPTESLPGFEFPDPLPQPLKMPPSGIIQDLFSASDRIIHENIDIGAYEYNPDIMYNLTLLYQPDYIDVILSGAGTYITGEIIEISAHLYRAYNQGLPGKSYEFIEWTGSHTYLLNDPYSPVTSLEMPNHSIIFTAVFQNNIPSPPSDLQANAITSSQIILNWADNSNNETGFIIERKHDLSDPWIQIADINQNTVNYHDTGLNPESTYYYRLKAYNSHGHSDYSNEASATTLSVTIDSFPVYRFFNTVRGGHLYTISEYERDYIIFNFHEWSYEGISFEVFIDNVFDTRPAYRFFNTITGIHIYTISEYERDTIMQINEWNYEGIAFFVHDEQVEDTIPVFRFFNSVRGGHLYTISDHEREYIISNLPEWNYEGISFYVISL